jgi:hypothetical protein
MAATEELEDVVEASLTVIQNISGPAYIYAMNAVSFEIYDFSICNKRHRA